MAIADALDDHGEILDVIKRMSGAILYLTSFEDDFHVIYMNEQYRDNYMPETYKGMDIEKKIIGIKYTDYAGDGKKNQFLPDLTDISKDGVGKEFNNKTLKKKDEVYRWIDWTGTPIRNKVGKFNVLCQIRDITERKMADPSILPEARKALFVCLIEAFPNSIDAKDLYDILLRKGLSPDKDGCIKLCKSFLEEEYLSEGSKKNKMGMNKVTYTLTIKGLRASGQEGAGVVDPTSDLNNQFNMSCNMMEYLEDKLNEQQQKFGEYEKKVRAMSSKFIQTCALFISVFAIIVVYLNTVIPNFPSDLPGMISYSIVIVGILLSMMLGSVLIFSRLKT